MTITQKNWAEWILDLAGNREDGAIEITRKVATVFAQLNHDTNADIRGSALVLLRGQPFMAPLIRCLGDILVAFERDGIEGVTHAATTWAMSIETAEEKLIDSVKRDISLNISPLPWAFFSASSTVLKTATALLEPSGKAIAIVGESHPGGEGKITAAELIKAGWEVELVPDSTLFDRVLAGGASKVVLGCDAIDPHLFLNKVGSGSLAAIAYQAGIDVELWTTTHKFFPEGTVQKIARRRSDSRDSEPLLFAAGSIQHCAVVRTELGAMNTDLMTRVSGELDEIPEIIRKALKLDYH